MATASLRQAQIGVVCVAAAVALGALISGCTGPNFEVGDCVTIELAGIRGHELEAAECEGAQGTLVASERIYRVDSMIEGTSGTCPMLQGFFPVQFTHEPEDVIYCLVQAGG